ncbi:MAG TPA: 50S ribosomal protein L29 [Oculatellaceae cyanobacterium]
MKVREIRELTHDDIKSRIDDTRKSIVELRFQLAMRKLESPAKLRQARKQLARLLTIQTEKVDAEIAAKPEKATAKA